MEHNCVKKFLLKIFLNGLAALFAFGFFSSAYAAEANKSSMLNALIDDGAETFLPPEVAFKLALKSIDANHIEASFLVQPKYYLYRERIKFEVVSPAEVKISQITLPNGDIKDDPNFGKQEVYHNDFKANIQLSAGTQSPVTINASYQGCSEKGLCYAPIKQTFTLNLPANAALASTSSVSSAANNLTASNEVDSTTQTVSYTHLDVYKRQGRSRTTPHHR